MSELVKVENARNASKIKPAYPFHMEPQNKILRTDYFKVESSPLFVVKITIFLVYFDKINLNERL